MISYTSSYNFKPKISSCFSSRLFHHPTAPPPAPDSRSLDPPAYLSPPAGQHKVGVDILLAKLFRHVEPQRAVLVVYVALGLVAENGVCVVDLLELVGRFRIVWV